MSEVVSRRLPQRLLWLSNLSKVAIAARAGIESATLQSTPSSGGSRGANPAMGPHRSWQWSLAPCTLGGRNSNDIIMNLCKCKDFGPPLIDVGYGFGPPTEN